MIAANLAPVVCVSRERSCMLGIKVGIKKFGLRWRSYLDD